MSFFTLQTELLREVLVRHLSGNPTNQELYSCRMAAR
jgi:hypothetical protein